MERLNIPFYTNTTARRHRRAVWPLIVLGVAVTLVIAAASRVWLFRDTLSTFAPPGTTVLHLTLSEDDWRKLSRDFPAATLVSNRHLTFRDLAGFAGRELAVFVGQDGETAVAVRSARGSLPMDLFDAYGINVESLGKKAVLLSDKPMATSKRGRTSLSLGSLLPGAIGSVISDDGAGGRRSRLLSDRAGYRVKIGKTGAKRLDFSNIPADVLAAASIPAGPLPFLADLTAQFDRLLAQAGLPLSSEITENLSKSGGEVTIIRGSATDISVLLSLPRTEDSPEISRVLRSLAALRLPTVNKVELPDGTFMEEYAVDPSAVRLDETSINGFSTLKASAGQLTFFSAETSEKVIFATDEDLLRTVLTGQKDILRTPCRSKASVYLHADLLGDYLNGQFYSPLPLILSFMAQVSEVSVRNGLTTDALYLCTI